MAKASRDVSFITLDYVKERFEYVPEDRTFPLVWKAYPKSPKFVSAGKRAGCMTRQGYVHVTLLNKICKLHRLVYMLKHNIPNLAEVPKSIDHVDRDKTNNTMENLRDGSILNNVGINSRNRDSLGQSKYRGVSVSDALRDKYNASISINLKETTIIYYKDEEYCAKVYKAACKYLGYEYEDDFSNVEDIPLPKDALDRIEKAKALSVSKMEESPYEGVTWSREKKKFVARLHVYVNNEGKNISLGYFTDPYEAAVRRDLYIIENKHTNKLQTISDVKDYTKYRALFPTRKTKLLKVTSKVSGEVKIFTGMTKTSDALHICKKNLSAFMNGRSENKYADLYDFEWVYEDKKC